jgi:hypothetical protein
MPSIEITTMTGYMTRIDSSDPDSIGKWFTETLLRFPECSHPAGGVRIRISPLYGPPSADHPHGVSDWEPDSRFNWYQFTPRPSQQGTIEEAMWNIHTALGNEIERLIEARKSSASE